MEYDYRIHSDPELGGGISVTIPDQNYTLRQILDRFTRGQSITGMGTYNDYDFEPNDEISFNDFKPHPKTLDLTERKLFAKEALQQIKNYNEKRKQSITQTEPGTP